MYVWNVGIFFCDVFGDLLEKLNDDTSMRAVPVLVFFRFLRYVPVVYVDYPGAISLTQIYGTFNRAMLRLVPSLRSSAQQLTDAMVEFYTMSQVLLFI